MDPFLHSSSDFLDPICFSDLWLFTHRRALITADITTTPISARWNEDCAPARCPHHANVVGPSAQKPDQSKSIKHLNAFTIFGEVPHLSEWGLVSTVTAQRGCLMQLRRGGELMPRRQILRNKGLEIGRSQQMCSPLFPWYTVLTGQAMMIFSLEAVDILVRHLLESISVLGLSSQMKC